MFSKPIFLINLILLIIFIPFITFANVNYWPVKDLPPYVNVADLSLPTVISMENVKFDIAKGTPALPQKLLYNYDPGTLDSFYIVHFRNTQWRKNKFLLQQLGVCLFQYVPNNAYIAWIPSGKYNKVINSQVIDWCGLYHPVYKISPYLSAINDAEFQEVEILVFRIEDLENIRSQLIQLGFKILMEDFNPNLPSFRGKIKNEMIVPTAYIQGVKWISPFREPVILNDTVPGLMQANCPDNNAICRPLWYEHGINGNHQLIGICDTGLDHDSCGFQAPVNQLMFQEFGDYRVSPKVPAYHVAPGGATAYDVGSGGHGTQVASLAAGDYTSNDENKYNVPMNGIASEAQIWLLDLGRGYNLLFNHGFWFNEMMAMMDAGASSINNSWGIYGWWGQYLTDDYRIDQTQWNKKTGIVCVAAGNYGPGSTLGSPANCKNGLSVGATYDYTNQNSVWNSSSRGPTSDNRIKPDVCVPGTTGSSSYIQAAYSDGNIDSNNCNYVQGSGGTSYSSPIVAGCIALIHQYFSEGFYPTGAATPTNSIDPSDALLKAMIINSAKLLTGAGVSFPRRPGISQGWGRVLLEDALYFTGQDKKLYIVDDKTGLYDGDTDKVYYREVNSSSQSLKITLTWTDSPGDPSRPTGKQLVNDLDLEARVGALTFYGNIFNNMGWSKQGSGKDNTNNVECVFLETPVVGTYEIKIKPVNIPQAPQPFALVVTGDIDEPPVSPPVTPMKIACSTQTVIIDGVLDPSEWKYSTKRYVDSGRSVQFPFYIYLKNDDNYIYFCLDAVGDNDNTGYHYAGVYFDSLNDKKLLVGSEDALEIYNSGSVQYSLWGGEGWNLYSESSNGIPFANPDRNQMGMTGAYRFNPTVNDPTPHFVYEYKIPLNLGDLDIYSSSKARFYTYLLAKNKESYYPPQTSWPDPGTYKLVSLCGTHVPVVSPVLLIILFVLTSIALMVIIQVLHIQNPNTGIN